MFGFGKKIRSQCDLCRARMPFGFVSGCAYIANSTPAFPAEQIVVVACGRDSGGGMTFVRVGDMATGRVRAMDGREFVELSFSNGVKYFVSSAVPADVDEASRVMGMIRGK